MYKDHQKLNILLMWFNSGPSHGNKVVRTLINYKVCMIKDSPADIV